VIPAFTAIYLRVDFLIVFNGALQLIHLVFIAVQFLPADFLSLEAGVYLLLIEAFDPPLAHFHLVVI